MTSNRNFRILLSIFGVFGLLQIVVSQDLTLKCPQGWTIIYDQCYLPVLPAPLPWQQALQLCQKYGGRLAEPSGFLMTEEIGELVKAQDASINNVWTGYHRNSSISASDDTAAYWSDGRRTAVDVGVWGHNEPNIQAGNCAYMSTTNNDWFWYMGLCDMPRPFVCEATPCPTDTFRCDNGRCVASSLTCNSENNCGDDSDERNCPNKCKRLIVANSGEIKYPEGSRTAYSNRDHCQWVIEGALGSRLQLQIVALDTESGVDFVEIWGGGRTLSTSVSLRRLSGTIEDALKVAGVVVSSNNLAIIRFVTDKTETNSGFWIRWRSNFQCELVKASGLIPVDGDGNPTSSNAGSENSCYERCRKNSACYAAKYTASDSLCYIYPIMPRTENGQSGNIAFYVKTCPGIPDSATLPGLPAMSSDLYATSTSQRLFSTLYPLYYPGGKTYMWTIRSPGRSLVTVQFLEVDLGVQDELRFYDGSTLNSNLLLTLTGTSQDEDTQVLMSTGSSMLVYFQSFGYSNAKGFLLAYYSGCDYSVRSNSGTVESPGYRLGSYPNIQTCTWTIQSMDSRALRLTFDAFDMETNKDFVQIFVNNTNTPVHSGSGYTGTSRPPTVDSSTGYIRLVMKTGAMRSRLGFKATYSAGCLPISDTSLVLNPTSNFVRGDVVTVTCITDYVFASPYTGQSSVRLTCGQGGEWTAQSIPTCIKKLCGTLPSINNGYLESTTGVFSGDTATYKCNTGFELFTTGQNSNKLTTCTSSGQWEPFPFCLSVNQCPPLLAPAFGKLDVLGNGRDHGTIALFSCTTEGYEIVGTAVMVCNFGTWSADAPTCQKVRCALPYIGNATLTPSTNLARGDIISVTCDSGFELSGPSIIQCGITVDLPSCINIDECSRGISGCNQICTDNIGGFTCSCRSGYQLDSDKKTCRDINECNTNNGNCDEFCTNSIGSYSCSCPFSSKELYTFNGQFGLNVPAGEDGTQPWNIYHINHTCVSLPDVTCPMPALEITNGNALVDQSSYGVGDTVSYLCDIGFELVGSSTLTCQSNGQWNVNPPTCRVAQCSPPSVPGVVVNPSSQIDYLAYFTGTCTVQGVGQVSLLSRCIYSTSSGRYQASITDLQCPTGVSCGEPIRMPGTQPYGITNFSYGSSFRFVCRNIYTIQGASSLTKNDRVACMGDGRWDFGDLRCIAPSCTDPGTPPGVIQDAVSYEEYSLVYFRCERTGFEPTDARPLQCQWNGSGLQWNGTSPQCVDVTPPVFSNCDQRDIIIPKLTHPAQADPTATDNVAVTTFRNPRNHFMSQILANDKFVTYEAKDAAGNTQTCEIFIKIKDDQPPKLECVASYQVRLQSRTSVQSVDMSSLVRSASDNTNSVIISYSPSQLTVTRDHIGKIYTIRITATDPSGNTDMCYVQIQVTAPQCVDWSLTVDHGSVTCNPTFNGYSCSVTCNSGYVFFEDPSRSSFQISCSNSGAWSREKPVCVARRDNDYRQNFQMSYLIGQTIAAQCPDIYLIQLQNSMGQLNSNLNNLCSNSGGQAVSVTFPVNTPTVAISSTSIVASYQIDISSTGLNSDVAVQQCANLIRNAFQSVSGTLTPIQRLNTQGGCSGSALASFQTSLQDGYGCGRNEQTFSSGGNQFCMACPPGWSSQNGAQCAKCPANTYFNNGIQECTSCPSDARNVLTGAASEMDCYLACPKGYRSDSGLALCEICPKNYYSSDRQTCTRCSLNLLTNDNGQHNSTACRSPCDQGSYSNDGLEPCTPCPRGFYQSRTEATTCSECPSTQTTNSAGSIDIADCVAGVPLLCDQFKCLNGGTCAVEAHEYFCTCAPGYTGRNCEIYINPCNSKPCYNNGICVTTGTTTYECRCTNQQLSGSRCEVLATDICNNNPCQNFGGCKTGVANYMCLCPSYSQFTYEITGFGSPCTRERDPCVAYPCQNGAACEAYGNIRRRCVCQPGYTGEACETDIDSCLSNPCKNGARCRDGPLGSVTCECPLGFDGSFCELRVDSCQVTTCPAFSNCVDNYLTGDFVCVCEEGFVRNAATGACVQQVLNPCDSNPCLNGGQCYQVGDTYSCICQSGLGYEGANCQHNIDDCNPNPCQHGGICTDIDPPPSTGYKFTCQCNPDTYGYTCLDNVNICAASTNPCNPGVSRCIDYYRDYFCECADGYYGKNCTESPPKQCDLFPCKHGATCIESGNSYICQCTDGYQGAQCENIVDNCASAPCQNGGVCQTHNNGYACSCQYGFRGDRCEIQYDLCDLANPCQGVGSTCTDIRGVMTCSCGVGYSGVYCQNKDATCTANSCDNGGTCSEAGAQISCSCPQGFTGSRCETNINDCAPNNCPTGSTCVDGLLSYTCQCDADRIGTDCSKIVSPEFDLLMTGSTAYQPSEYQHLVQPINDRAFTVSTWVRFTRLTEPGTILTLMGLNSEDDFSDPVEILRMDKSAVSLSFSSSGSTTTRLALPRTVSDGYWHHIAVTWDANQGAVSLYIDGQLSNTASNYATRAIRPYGWLVLGGKVDSNGQVDHSGGMIGRLSHTYISDRALNAGEIQNLANDNAAVPPAAISGYTSTMATGAVAAVDYNRELSTGNCAVGSLNCRNINEVSARPEFSSCPDDQTLVSPRVSNITWQEPVILTGSLLQSTRTPGTEPLGWDTYGVTYATLDKQGSADVCTFRVYNRRTACTEPTPIQGGTLQCQQTDYGLRCSYVCDNNMEISDTSPKYYTCGTGGMYDTSERIVQFTPPSCSECKTPLRDVFFQLNFTMSGSPRCNTATQTQLEDQLRTQLLATLNTLKDTWPKLCATSFCSDVTIELTCSDQYGTHALLVLRNREEIIPNLDNSLTMNVGDVLLTAAADNNAMLYSGVATPDLKSVVVNSVPKCEAGTVLLGDCCSECGLGHYFNTNSGQCRACPIGTYLDQFGLSGTPDQSPCKPCPSNRLKTAQAGSDSINDCYSDCQMGNYYNMTTGQCTSCPVGFYSQASGNVYCDACPYFQTTADIGTMTQSSCTSSPTTQAPLTTAAPPNTGSPNAGASTGGEDSLTLTLLIVLAVILFIIVAIVIILFCCCRAWIEKICPCLVAKVTPEEKSQWHYVNRFGETNMKFVSYKMGDVQGRRSDKESLVSEEDNRSVHTNISLQVPIFEEKLNGSVTKKSIHVAEHTHEEDEERKKSKKRKRSKSRRRRRQEEMEAAANESGVGPQSLPPLQRSVAPAATQPEKQTVVRRPLSAFNKPKPNLDQVPYNDFLPQHSAGSEYTPRSRITLDSDDDLR